MDPDKIAATVFLGGVVYTVGVLNRGWTSPLDIAVDIVCWAGGHRWCTHEEPSSDADDDEDDQADELVSTRPLRDAPTTLREAPGYVDLKRRDDPRSQGLHQGEGGVAWARRQVEAGILSPSEIDAIGAEKFGKDERTIRRWRKAAGDDRPDTDRSESA